MYSIQKNKPSNTFYRLLSKKAHLITLVCLAFSHSLFAQQEIYLDNTPKDSISIKTLKGIELGYNGIFNTHEIISYLSYDSNQSIMTKNEFQLNYFHEFKLLPSLGVIAKGGFYLIPSRKPILDSGYYSNMQNIKYKNVVYAGLQLSLEPRWYFGYKTQYMKGKGALNSGWYIGLPMEAVNYKIANVSRIAFNFSTNFGYRHAIAKKIFLEGSIGYSISNFAIYTAQPVATLKVAYCL